METLIIDYGVYTMLEFDFTEFDFNGITKVIWTVKKRPNPNDKVLFSRSFTEPKVYLIKITPEESKLLDDKYNCYDYIVINKDNECNKNGDNGEIVLRRGVGQCPNK